MLRLNQVKINLKNDSPEAVRKKAAMLLGIPEREVEEVRIVKRSVDARKKPELFYVYTVDIKCLKEEQIYNAALKKKGLGDILSKTEEYCYRFPEVDVKKVHNSLPPVIAGMGPAGLFCGYFLAMNGFRPVILERGKCVEERRRDVEKFWENGILNPGSNVQFGEGGAGTFSDGKLNTLVKDKNGRNRAVLETFVKLGAKESILYDAKPHIGTDVLADLVKKMREEIIGFGGKVLFESCVTDVKIENEKVCGVEINRKDFLACDKLVLAVGHSARDTFFMLQEKKIPMEPKPFAVGFRVQHPQKMINESQYGTRECEKLGAASYKVAAKTSLDRGVYSFCMCPGGYVVNASSEEGMTAVNGMSYSQRDGENANSAVIVSVTPEDYPGEGALAGIEFQRELERRAYECGGGKIPLQRYGEFREKVSFQRQDQNLTKQDLSKKDSLKPDTEEENMKPACKGEYVWTDLTKILPQECNQAFVEGMEAFGRQICGFDRDDTILAGVESRTSSAVRILRDETLQSKVRGLFPCGEGAGYAGGITSAAMDGIKVAEQIASGYCKI